MALGGDGCGVVDGDVDAGGGGDVVLGVPRCCPVAGGDVCDGGGDGDGGHVSVCEGDGGVVSV